ncbi:MAG: hypothetical protein EB829_04660 [Nitrosopumilus sp. H8]|nr:MAG: hypothetical protein EB829_04660 [Nitrosopumilus sp. H8]
MGMRFDSILPGEIPGYSGDLVLTTRAESPACAMPVLYEDVLEFHPTVTRGMMMQRLGPGLEIEDLVLGVDPGQRTGLSVFYHGQEIESSVYPSADSLVSHIIEVMGGLWARRKIVKIGNGNMGVAKKIIDMLNLRFCSSFELEFVDEQRTSPKIKNHNQGGKRDMLSARYISRREGCRRSVLPLSMTG